MNRQIKFRGLRVDGKGWVYGYYWIIDEHFTPTLSGINYIKSINNGIDYGVIPESVGQFTGLMSKKGTEIYEGDVVQWHNASGIHYNMGIVTWCNTLSAYVVKNHDHEDYIYDVHYAEIGVIGNIHENK